MTHAETPTSNAPKGRILLRGHGLPVDHIALATPDVERGVAYVESLTGVVPTPTTRNPKHFFWSAGLSIGEDSFLEVIGPNPDHRGVHPLKSFMAGLTAPTLLFWYLATDDFAACRRRVEALGETLKMVVTVSEDESVDGADYTRGAIGSGFSSQRPGLIEWRRHSLDHGSDQGCRLTEIKLCHPQPEAVNALFEGLGVDLVVETGDSLISITLQTPKGDVTLSNPGVDLTPLGLIAAVLKRPFG